MVATVNVTESPTPLIEAIAVEVPDKAGIVHAPTVALPFRMRETVPSATPACAATSLMVGLFCTRACCVLAFMRMIDSRFQTPFSKAGTVPQCGAGLADAGLRCDGV